MVWVTIGVDAIPMVFNQFGKASKGHQPLPFQAVFPTFEKSECASFGAVAPEISKAFHLGDTLVRHISAQLAHMHSVAYSAEFLLVSREVLHARRHTLDNEPASV